MKRMVLFVFTTFVVFTAVADDARKVYIIRDLNNPSSDTWTANMVLPVEAVRLYAPSRFSKSGKSVDISIATDVSYSVSGPRELERSAAHTLVVFEIGIAGAEKLPKPDKRVKTRFSLSELLKAGSVAAESPGFFALRKVIGESTYKSGMAWLESIEYDGKGRFLAVVALKK